MVDSVCLTVCGIFLSGVTLRVFAGKLMTGLKFLTNVFFVLFFTNWFSGHWKERQAYTA